MNAGLYLLSYLSLACILALAAWSSPNDLRLPAFTRIVLGFSATPLVLAIGTLALTLFWPMAPRAILVGWPASLVFILAATRPSVARQTLVRAWRRLRRGPSVSHEFSLSAVVLLAAVVLNLAGNTRQPIVAHDALIYINEARVFAETPTWDTYLDMVNPAEPDSLVSGHTHTWLYPTFLAQALLATNSTSLGAGHDLIARCAGQFNLLLMLLAVAGLVWAATGKNAILTIVASAATACIPHISYVTAHSSIDAFRILPLLLLGNILISGPRRISTWLLASTLVATSVAAHTLNICLVPLLIISYLVPGQSAVQWCGFVRVFLPGTLIAALPVVAFYFHLWRETGHVLGNGLHYIFYAGTPLESIARRGILSDVKPTLVEVWKTLATNYSWWVTVGPLAGLAFCFLPRAASSLRFLTVFFIGSWCIILSGIAPIIPATITRIFLGNVRYSLAVWVFGIALAAAGLSALVGSIYHEINLSFLLRRSLSITILAATCWFGWSHISSTWPTSYSHEEALRVGELRIAEEVTRTVQSGESWMTDRNTTAYYTTKSGIFLYTPAGRMWIQVHEPIDAWSMLCKHRVRLVAFSNRDPEWWPSTALYAALNQPGHAKIVDLLRWRIYIVNLPPMELTPNQQ